MPRSHQAHRVKSFFKVVTTGQARAQLQGFAPVGTERIPVARAFRRVLAEDLRAPVDLPHFHRSNMDGYAVRAADTFGASPSIPAYLRIAGTIEMGKQARRRLRRGEAMRIATGGMLPPGADAVVMIEHTDEVSDGTVEVHRGVSPWEHVLRIGEDITAGTPIFSRGRRLRARDLGALTGVGVTRISVFKRPRAALLSTGDEIIGPTQRPKPGQVRNINQYSLQAMAEEAGALLTLCEVVADRRDLLRQKLATALARSDVVLLSGGSSVGTKDIALDTITSFPRAEILLHGISVAPGKPTLLGRALGKPILGLPGHPVSALVIFDLFGAPLLRLLGGEMATEAFAPRRTVNARLTENVASQPGREDYIRVELEEQDGGLAATPIPGKSGAIFSLVRAVGLVRIDAGAEGIEAGSDIEVIVF